MFALSNRPTEFRFEKLEAGEQPLYEGSSETLRILMRGPYSYAEADRAIVAEALTPKPKPFIFVVWREEPGGVSLGFQHDPVFGSKSSERPSWFKSLA
jgi:hypothetical protein